MREQRTLRVLVSLPTISHPERLKLEGLLAYAHEKTGSRWRVELDFGALAGRPTNLRLSNYDGLVAYVDSDARRQEIVSAKIPCVLIEDVLAPRHPPRARHVVTLLCDHEAEGRAAADYFLARHFTAFAWLGPGETSDWSAARHAGYRGRLREARLDCADLTGPAAELPRRLATLPKPCALFAAHDFCAREALEAALSIGLNVPRDLAILGVDNDDVICTTVAPALSSLPTNDVRLGYAAGRILNELLVGDVRGGRIIRFASRHVISRLSTDADALADPFVAAALRAVRNNLSGDIDAASLARKIGYSKHMLQIRAERALGHTLGEEIRLMRLAAARELIFDTDMPIAQVAETCGFTSVSHLALRFRESFGCTPLAARRRDASVTSRSCPR